MKRQTLFLLAASASLTALAAQAQVQTITETGTDTDDVQIVSAKLGGSLGQSENYCSGIDVSIVVKTAALKSPVFSAIGFYSNFSLNTSFGAPGGNVTLKSGESAQILKYTGKGMCWAGDMSSSEYQVMQFKPNITYKWTDQTGNIHIITRWAQGSDGWIGQIPYPQQAQSSFDYSSSLFQ